MVSLKYSSNASEVISPYLDEIDSVKPEFPAGTLVQSSHDQYWHLNHEVMKKYGDIRTILGKIQREPS